LKIDMMETAKVLILFHAFCGGVALIAYWMRKVTTQNVPSP